MRWWPVPIVAGQKVHLLEVGFLLNEESVLRHPNFQDLDLMCELLQLLHSGIGNALVPSFVFRGTFRAMSLSCKKSLEPQLATGFHVQLVHLMLLRDV